MTYFVFLQIRFWKEMMIIPTISILQISVIQNYVTIILKSLRLMVSQQTNYSFRKTTSCTKISFNQISCIYTNLYIIIIRSFII